MRLKERLTQILGFISSAQPKAIENNNRVLKSFADVFSSSRLANRLLITSCNVSILLAVLSISGLDNKLADKIFFFLGTNVFIAYWLIYLMSSIFALLINIYFTFLEVRNSTLNSEDWIQLKRVLLKSRPIYNFSTKDMETRSVPLYPIYLFVALVLFGLWLAFESLIFTPIERISESKPEFIYKVNSSSFYTFFMFSNFPPYLLLMLAILFARIKSEIINFFRDSK